MKKNLQAEYTKKEIVPYAIILDGCAIFWVVHWPAAGETPTDFAEYVFLYVLNLSNSDILFGI